MAELQMRGLQFFYNFRLLEKILHKQECSQLEAELLASHV